MLYEAKDVRRIINAHDNLTANMNLCHQDRNEVTTRMLLYSIRNYCEEVPLEVREGVGREVVPLEKVCEEYLLSLK